MKTTNHAMHRIHKLDQYEAAIAKMQSDITAAQTDLDRIRGIYKELTHLHTVLSTLEAASGQEMPRDSW